MKRVLWIMVLAGLSACESGLDRPVPHHPTAARGMTLADWTADGYAGPGLSVAMTELAGVGVDTIILIPTAYQDHARDDHPRVDQARTPTVASIRTAIQAAHAMGMTVALKPHVDRDDGGWRGAIRPDDVATWFDEYRVFLQPWLNLVTEESVDTVVIGTELAGLVEEEGEWGSLIQWARSLTSARLGYAASWDEAGRVPFWDRLDFVGIDFYYPVATRDDAGRWEMLLHWQPWLQRLELLHRQANLPIVLTEIGYRSVDGAGQHPFEFATDGSEDAKEQADLYWAALAATAEQPWLTGIWWWNWLVSGGGGPGDLDFTPRQKPAASVLEEAWR